MLKTDPFLRADGWVKRMHFGCRRPVPKIDVSCVLQQEQTKRPKEPPQQKRLETKQPGRAAAAKEKTERPRAAATRAEKAARHGRWFARSGCRIYSL